MGDVVTVAESSSSTAGTLDDGPTLLYLERGDVVLTRSTSWLGRAIRWATREGDEEPSVVNHAGCVVSSGPVEIVHTVEAIGEGVVLRGLWEAYAATSTTVSIWRPLNLELEQINEVSRFLQSQIGQSYGWWALPVLLARRRRIPRVLIDLVAPRLFHQVWWCSHLVALAFERVGLDFGVQSEVASPDDMWDFCSTHPAIYEPVYPLGPLSRDRLRSTSFQPTTGV